MCVEFGLPMGLVIFEDVGVEALELAENSIDEFLQLGFGMAVLDHLP